MVAWLATNDCTNTCTGIIWNSWLDNGTATTSSSVSTWATWINDGTGSSTIVRAPRPPTVVRTNAELRADEQARQAVRDRCKAADAKAQALLREHLTNRQRNALDKHGWFLVEGGKSKKTYRVSGLTYAGNIVELEDKKEIARYCVHSSSELPLGDQLLSQLLHLKFDEEHFIAKANRTNLAAA